MFVIAKLRHTNEKHNLILHEGNSEEQGDAQT